MLLPPAIPSLPPQRLPEGSRVTLFNCHDFDPQAFGEPSSASVRCLLASQLSLLRATAHAIPCTAAPPVVWPPQASIPACLLVLCSGAGAAQRRSALAARACEGRPTQASSWVPFNVNQSVLSAQEHAIGIMYSAGAWAGRGLWSHIRGASSARPRTVGVQRRRGQLVPQQSAHCAGPPTLPCSRRDMQQLAELTDHKAGIVLWGERHSSFGLKVCVAATKLAKQASLLCVSLGSSYARSSSLSSTAPMMGAAQLRRMQCGWNHSCS